MDNFGAPSWGGYSGLMSLPSDGDPGISISQAEKRDNSFNMSNSFSICNTDFSTDKRQTSLGDLDFSFFKDDRIINESMPDTLPETVDMFSENRTDFQQGVPRFTSNFHFDGCTSRDSSVLDTYDQTALPCHRYLSNANRRNKMVLPYQRLSCHHTNLGAFLTKTSNRSSDGCWTNDKFSPFQPSLRSAQIESSSQIPTPSIGLFSSELDCFKSYSQSSGISPVHAERRISAPVSMQSNNASRSNQSSFGCFDRNSFNILNDTYLTDIGREGVDTEGSGTKSSFDIFGPPNCSRASYYSASPSIWKHSDDSLSGLLGTLSLENASNMKFNDINKCEPNQNYGYGHQDIGFFTRRKSIRDGIDNPSSDCTAINIFSPQSEAGSSHTQLESSTLKSNIESPISLPKPLVPDIFHGTVYLVRFKRTAEWFLPSIDSLGNRKLCVNNFVKVEADRGTGLGMVEQCVSVDEYLHLTTVDKDGANAEKRKSMSRKRKKKGKSNVKDSKSNHEAEDDFNRNEKKLSALRNLKCILSLAAPNEVECLVRKAEEEAKIVKICHEKVKAHKLPMTIVDAEYQFDRNKLTFFFNSDRRIDFRDLVRELFSLYKTRIWMEQVKEVKTVSEMKVENKTASSGVKRGKSEMSTV